jgi:hypothetical protein
MSFRTALMGGSDQLNDRRLLRSVRAELGRVSSHPHAIDVEVSNGAVTLRGPVLNTEVADILSCVESVRGVRCLQYEFDGYASPDSIDSMEESARMMHSHGWSPAMRTAATAGLVATGAWAMMRARA